MFYRLRAFYPLIVGNIVITLVLFLKLNRLPPQVPLFYSLPLGEDQLGDSWMIFILPILMNLIFILNNLIYQRYFKDNLLIKQIFFYLNLFIIASFTFIFVKIVFVIT